MKKMVSGMIACIFVIALTGCGGESNNHEGEAKHRQCQVHKVVEITKMLFKILKTKVSKTSKQKKTRI